MTASLIVAAILLTASTVVFFLGGVYFVGLTVVGIAIGWVLLSASRASHRQGHAAGLLALAIASTYSSSYLYIFDQSFGLTSDAFLYDQVALMATSTPIVDQLNPVNTAYVFEAGYAFGYQIANPGFYKLLGILYTIADWLGLRDPSVQIPLSLNLVSYSVAGYSLYHLMRIIAGERNVLWLLLPVVFLAPYVLALLPWARKDLFLFAATLVALLAICRGANPAVIILLIMMLWTLRPQQAALVLVFYLTIKFQSTNFISPKFFRTAALLAGVFTIGLAIAYGRYLAPSEISDESLSALQNNLQHSVGYSRFLTSSELGIAVYVLLYPLPIALPDNLASLMWSVFCYLHYFIFGGLLMGLAKRRRRKSVCRASENAIFNAFLVTLFLTLAGLVGVTIGSWAAFDFIVLEPRYKLLALALTVILFSRFAGRASRSAGWQKQIVVARQS